MIILQDSQIKKIFHNGDEVKKILDWDGNVVFVKKSAPVMTNTIKFHTTSAVTSSTRFTVTYTDSTSDEMRYSEPNKQYVFQIPTDKIVKGIDSDSSKIDEIIFSCKVSLSTNLISGMPNIVKFISCDATSNKSLSNAFTYVANKSVEVRNLDARNATNLDSLFYNASSLESIVLRDLNVSKATSMQYMFRYCSGATTIDVTNWDTSSATNLKYAFANCTKVTSLDISSWNVSNVTNMSYMFSYCTSLASLDLSGWNTNNATDMSYMFGSCEKLTSLDVSHFNTNNVTNMAGMFSRCPKLASLDLSGWNTAKVTNMADMFMLCQAKSLDLSGWDMTNVNNTSYMFFRCNSLRTIRMIGCNQTTIDKIKSALTSAGILNNVTIVTE